jgi:hypothetical protein
MNAIRFQHHSLTHSLTHGAEPFLISCQLCSHSRNSQHFMEPEGSLPCSQQPSTGLYPEPDQSNPSIPPYLSKVHLILSTHLRLGLPSGLLPPGFPTNILYAFLFSPIRAACPEQLILLDLIILILMLGGSVITTAWRVLRLRMEETPSSFGG